MSLNATLLCYNVNQYQLILLPETVSATKIRETSDISKNYLLLGHFALYEITSNNKRRYRYIYFVHQLHRQEIMVLSVDSNHPTNILKSMCLSVRGPVMWNKVHKDLKNSTNVNMFKKGIKPFWLVSML